MHDPTRVYTRILIFLGIVELAVLLYVGVAQAVTVAQIGNGGTGTGTVPTYGQLLIGGKNGEYEYVSTSTLIGQSSVSSVFGRTGAVTAQTGDYTTSQVTEGSNLYWTQVRFDNALSATTSVKSITNLPSLLLPYTQLTGTPDLTQYFRLSDWYATTTDGLKEGSTNLYFTNARADARFVADLAATTSVASITTLSHLSLPYAQLTGTPAIASSTLLGDNNGFTGNDTFSQTIGGSITGNAGTASTLQTSRTINSVSFNGSSNITVTAASSTALLDNDSFSGTVNFTGTLKINGTTFSLPVTIGNGGTGTSTPASYGNVLAYNGSNYQAIATSTLGLTTAAFKSANVSQWTNDAGYITGNQTVTLSGDVTGSGSTAITTTFNLANTHFWSARQNFTNATSSGLEATSSNVFLDAFTSAILSTNQNGQVVASSSIGSNYITGPLGTINGQTLTRGGSVTVSTASSTLLGDNNAFTGVDSFSNTSSNFAGTLSGDSLSTILSSAFSTTSASYFLSLNQGNAFSTTSANYWKTQQSFTGASTTLLGDSNTFTGNDSFTNASSNFAGTFQGHNASYFQTALSFPLTYSQGGTGTSTPANYGNILEWNGTNYQGSATSSLGLTTSAFKSANVSQWTNDSGYITANQTITLSGDISGSGATSIATAFNLANSHFWQATQNFSNASTSELTATSTLWLTAITNCNTTSALTTDANGKVGCGSISGAGGSGIGTVATSAAETAGQVAIAATTNGYPAKLYWQSTSTPSIGSVVNYSGTLGNFIGGISGTFGIANSSITNAMLAHPSLTLNGTLLTLGDAADTITAASSSLLGDNSTFSGTVTFSNIIHGSINGNANTATALAANGTNCAAGYYPTGVDVSGNSEGCTYAVSTTTPWSANQFVVTNSAGIEYSVASSSLNLPNSALQNSSITVNTVPISLGGTATISAASSTLLANSNSFSGNNLFSASTTFSTVVNLNQSSSTLTTLATIWIPSLTNAILSTNSTGQVVASSSIGVNYLSGTLSIAKGGTNAGSFTSTTGILAYNGTSVVNFANFTLSSTLLSTLNASSTLFSGYQAFLGGTATDTFATNGTLTLQDADNSWSGISTPTRYLTLLEGTTTTFTASTSGAYVPSIVATFAGTIKNVKCLASTTASFVGVAPFIGSTLMTPSYFVASNTVGTILFTGNNTFTAGQTIGMYVGTTTSDTKQIFTSCTFQVVQTS